MTTTKAHKNQNKSILNVSFQPKMDWETILDITNTWNIHEPISGEKRTEVDEADSSKKVVTAILAGLFSGQIKPLNSFNEDIQVMKRLVKSAVEAKEEEILTQSEAEVLIEFIISKFIERKLQNVLKNISNANDDFNFGYFKSLKSAIQ
jgi:hypothetical protein